MSKSTHRWRAALTALSLLALLAVVGTWQSRAVVAEEGADGQRLFELRTYIPNEGKLDSLQARFRDHTVALFEKHGMTNIGYWVPVTESEADRTLVYLLAFPSAEARQASWKAFLADPEWQKARAESEVDGALVKKVISQLMTPTDYSEIQ